MINGIVNVYKEKGYTSHDVVAKLRGILKQKKIGHTGTLDPDAEGVLPVCLGRGTKLCDMLTDKDKVYEAVMLLGKTTDTQDVSGKVIEERPVSVSECDVLEAISEFVGDYDQIPPMYSAIKVNGKKLYELARAGIEIDRKARPISIRTINVNEIDFSEAEKTVTFTVECSKGTYIRTLCQDIGEKLGCGACMKSLKRTRVGTFELADSLTLAQIETKVREGTFMDNVKSVDGMFPTYKKVTVGAEYNKLIYNGNAFDIRCIEDKETEFFDLEKIRVYDENGSFIGIYVLEGDTFKLVKMFYDAEL